MSTERYTATMLCKIKPSRICTELYRAVSRGRETKKKPVSKRAKKERGLNNFIFFHRPKEILSEQISIRAGLPKNSSPEILSSRILTLESYILLLPEMKMIWCVNCNNF
jgi:hypothetical protein